MTRKTICRRTQRRWLGGSRHPRVRAHLEACPVCRGVAAAAHSLEHAARAQAQAPDPDWESRVQAAALAEIRLSPEHSEWRAFALDELSEVQRRRVQDCLDFDGKVKSEAF